MTVPVTGFHLVPVDKALGRLGSLEFSWVLYQVFETQLVWAESRLMMVVTSEEGFLNIYEEQLGTY